MATAAVAVPSHAPQQPRRSASTGSQTVPVHYPLTGFVRIEEGSSSGKRAAPRPVGAALTASSKKAAPSSKASAPSSKTAATHSKACSRWLYGVLLPGKLQLYARRTDYKRKVPPSDEIRMQVRAPSTNESVFGFDHECVYIRCKDTSRVVTVRIHQKKEIVRWVTALYYQSFNSDGKSPLATGATTTAANGKHDSERPPEPGSASTADAAASSVATTKRKSVSFHDVPDVLMLPRESVDPAELFYSVREYEQFQQKHVSGNAAKDDDGDDGDGGSHDNSSSSAGAPPKKNLSRLMKSIYAKTAAKLRVSHKRSSMEQLR